MGGKKPRSAVAALVLWTCSGLAAAVANDQPKLTPRGQLHLYLLMGQSNMAGRGKMTEADRRPVPRVWMLDKENWWVPAAHPIHFDKPAIAGVGLGICFAKRMMAEDDTIQIGLIPCAFGGTPLSRWSKGGDLYQNALARAKAARNDGVLKGVLWHQGESDSGSEETAKTYAERLAAMIRDLRADLESPGLPFVAGRLGEFYLRSGRTPYAATVDAALADLPHRVDRTACAGAQGLEHNGDQVHFGARALRELGRRYAEQMIRLTGQ
ncbi:MAG: sialate O-acetylesterase [Planctomycetota bacterium]